MTDLYSGSNSSSLRWFETDVSYQGSGRKFDSGSGGSWRAKTTTLMENASMRIATHLPFMGKLKTFRSKWYLCRSSSTSRPQVRIENRRVFVFGDKIFLRLGIARKTFICNPYGGSQGYYGENCSRSQGWNFSSLVTTERRWKYRAGNQRSENPRISLVK